MKSLRATFPHRGKTHDSRETFHYVSSQHANQPLSTYEGRWFCRYGYGLSFESASYGDKGQDFAAVYIDGDECTFVLCDGVSMSYHGDFAAKYLGEALFAWMNETKDWTSSLLYQFLMSLTIPASRELSNYEGAQHAHLPVMLREVLETKKKYGSQSMYICGKVKLGSGKKGARLQLAWQGDSRIRLFRNGQENGVDFEDKQMTAQRWSTAEGPVGGNPYVHEVTLPAGEEVVLRLYTDGMGELDPIGVHLPDEEIQVLMDAPHTGGLEDDAAFIELKWTT